MRRKILAIVTASLICILLTLPCFASAGSVGGVVEETWKSASQQIKQVVNNVVFPALSLILAVAFFVKLAGVWFDYRKHSQIEWAPPVILFVCLIFSLLAPQYIWQIIGG